MARPRKLTPRYLQHSASGRARAVWTDAAGTYHDVLLPGFYGSEESRRAYGRLLLETAVTPAGADRKRTRDGLSLVEVLDTYLTFATGYYRNADGTPTSTIHEVRIVLKSL